MFTKDLDILNAVESKEKETVALPASVMVNSRFRPKELRFGGSWDDIAKVAAYIWKNPWRWPERKHFNRDGLDTFVYNFPLGSGKKPPLLPFCHLIDKPITTPISRSLLAVGRSAFWSISIY